MTNAVSAKDEEDEDEECEGEKVAREKS